MHRIELELNTQQVTLLAAHARADGLAGLSAVVGRALSESDPIPYSGLDPARPRNPTPKRDRPVVAEYVIQPGTGKGVPVLAGQIIRVEQIHGGQCADVNVFNLRNGHEHLHVGRTRSLHGKSPARGDLVWSRAPWERPLLAILEDTGQTDTLVPYCSALLYWRLFGQRQHTNCQQMQIEAQREYGLPPYAVHESLNLFMYVDQDEAGVPVIRPNPAGAGDFIELLAYLDVLAVVNVCGDDMGVTNNFVLRELRVVVLDAGDDDRALGQELLREDHPSGLLPQPYDIPAAPLLADPDYAPAFPHAPVVVQTVPVELTDGGMARLESLAKRELYGDDLAASLRDLAITWATNRPRVEQ